MSSFRSGGVVRFSETDASGRFHYAAALAWAENTEHEVYRAAGVPVARFPRRTVSATFDRPLVDGDPYTVELDVHRVGTSSITYGWRIITGDVAAVTGSHTVVHVDEAGRAAPLPPVLRDSLQALTAEPA